MLSVSEKQLNTTLMGATPRPVEILLVEDNPGDVRLTIEALKSNEVSSRVTVAEDGSKAIRYLHREENGKDAPRPDLVLLDLNLPKRNGHEVLKEIKEDPDLMRIPVIILTSSEARTDIVESYSHHANCYITKPADLSQFLEVVKSVEHFWSRVAKLPPRS